MRSFLPSCVLVFASLLPAQDPPPAAAAPAAPAVPATPADTLAAAKARLQQALQKTATRTNTAFAAQWGLASGKQPAANDGAARFAANQAASGSGKATGSWHADRLHVSLETAEADELVFAGRRMIAREGGGDWKVRHERFTDGNTIPFVPDAAVLLQQLATFDLAVAHRTVGALDDRPVEILTLTLTPDQVIEALWSGLLPPALTMGSQATLFRMLAAGNAQRRAPPSPDATVDLVAYVDPATDVVHQLHFRMWAKSAAAARGGVMVAQGGAVVQVVGGAGAAPAQDEEDDEAAKNGPPTDGSVRDEQHLPVRSRKDTMVSDYTLRLTEHGTKATPQLSDGQKKLLGL